MDGTTNRRCKCFFYLEREAAESVFPAPEASATRAKLEAYRVLPVFHETLNIVNLESVLRQFDLMISSQLHKSQYRAPEAASECPAVTAVLDTARAEGGSAHHKKSGEQPLSVSRFAWQFEGRGSGAAGTSAGATSSSWSIINRSVAEGDGGAVFDAFRADARESPPPASELRLRVFITLSHDFLAKATATAAVADQQLPTEVTTEKRVIPVKATRPPVAGDENNRRVVASSAQVSTPHRAERSTLARGGVGEPTDAPRSPLAHRETPLRTSVITPSTSRTTRAATTPAVARRSATKTMTTASSATMSIARGGARTPAASGVPKSATKAKNPKSTPARLKNGYNASAARAGTGAPPPRATPALSQGDDADESGQPDVSMLDSNEEADGDAVRDGMPPASGLDRLLQPTQSGARALESARRRSGVHIQWETTLRVTGGRTSSHRSSGRASGRASDVPQGGGGGAHDEAAALAALSAAAGNGGEGGATFIEVRPSFSRFTFLFLFLLVMCTSASDSAVRPATN
jgi:hypothetical protein